MIQIAVDCYRIACATQPEMLHRSLWQQKTACRVCRIHLNYRCLTEEERKSHFLNAGRNASRLQTCSHPFYKAALTRLKKGSCPLPWRSLLYYSLTNQKSRLTRNLFFRWHISKYISCTSARQNEIPHRCGIQLCKQAGSL